MALEDVSTAHQSGRRGFKHTGEGRCNRVAASFSAGASKATTGAPKVTPMSDDTEPPNE